MDRIWAGTRTSDSLREGAVVNAGVLFAVWLTFSIVNAWLVFRYIYRETASWRESLQVTFNMMPLCLYGPALTLAVALFWLRSRLEK